MTRFFHGLSHWAERHSAFLLLVVAVLGMAALVWYGTL
jgi:hypothetical protein